MSARPSSQPRAVLSIQDPPAAQSPSTTKAVPCRSFTMIGSCPNGDQCPYLHPEDPAFPSSPSGKGSMVCRNLATQGVCNMEGRGCEYSHDRKLLISGWKTASIVKKGDR
eukprot:TRINITY_DN7485_c1_g3_i2.p1 TRINITY_DN7485_c1_g3~~TRINITY_DN7485_c1_g3_i2.p1  ORF type:complete len:110 (+),score=6.60 TRINITY_DN7485_c1_g3_i2:46-375(+)